MTIYAYERIGEISKEYFLPNWWVESVIVEYFDCRRFAEPNADQIWTFDFTILKDDDIQIKGTYLSVESTPRIDVINKAKLYVKELK